MGEHPALAAISNNEATERAYNPRWGEDMGTEKYHKDSLGYRAGVDNRPRCDYLVLWYTWWFPSKSFLHRILGG